MADSHIVVTDVTVGGKKTRTSLQTVDGTEMHVPYTIPIGADGGAPEVEIAAGQSVAITGTVGVNNFPATQPVSIATMPTTPVTGTFYPDTQPVSISSMPSTPVTGTFWPTTQPISGAVSVSGSVAVTGTFYPDTQPVSIAGVKLIDQDGAAYGVRHIDNKPRVSAMPYTFDIAEGNVTGHTSWSKIGYNDAIGATEEMMWPLSTAYTWPTGALTMTIVSSSIEDDADKVPAGTGAYTVGVYYLTTGFVEKYVTVTMNGTGTVQIATDIYRIQQVHVETTGTALAPVGALTIASGGTTYGHISAGRTVGRRCAWTVPTGKTLFVTNLAFACADQAASKYARFMLRANYDHESGLVLQRGLFHPFAEVVLNNSAYQRDLIMPIKFPATTDLYVGALANAAAQGTCSVSGWVETA